MLLCLVGVPWVLVCVQVCVCVVVFVVVRVVLAAFVVYCIGCGVWCVVSGVVVVDVWCGVVVWWCVLTWRVGVWLGLGWPRDARKPARHQDETKTTSKTQ